MKLVLISDTHGIHPETLPEGDVLIHAGDLCRKGTLEESAFAVSWLKRQEQFRHVIFIGGNHDFPLEAFMKENAEEMFRSHVVEEGFVRTPWVHYLRDTSVIIDGHKFYGAPWTPFFASMAFNIKRGPDMAEKWALIPENTDVLITHCPPYGVLDWYGQKRLGCEDLFERVEIVKPLVHVFGHVHNAYGEDARESLFPTKFFNAAITKIKQDSNGDSFYSKHLNAPWVVEI